MNPITHQLGRPADDAATESMLERIRQAAKEPLAFLPEVKATVLFGSRARGDHSPLSDWDAASNIDEGDRVKPVLSRLQIRKLPCTVQFIALPETLMSRNVPAIADALDQLSKPMGLVDRHWRIKS